MAPDSVVTASRACSWIWAWFLCSRVDELAADAIWTKLGDTSDDINWYSKRAILSGVYGSTLLFWLGDTSDGYAATWAFLERRISNVMQFEKLKSQVRGNPVLSKLMAIPNAFLSNVKAPRAARRSDLPGYWAPRGGEKS
jgi:ubiquinone biosynthesis protein COQ9